MTLTILAIFSIFHLISDYCKKPEELEACECYNLEMVVATDFIVFGDREGPDIFT